jgi:hypothetical protein
MVLVATGMKNLDALLSITDVRCYILTIHQIQLLTPRCHQPLGRMVLTVCISGESSILIHPHPSAPSVMHLPSLLKVQGGRIHRGRQEAGSQASQSVHHTWLDSSRGRTSLVKRCTRSRQNLEIIDLTSHRPMVNVDRPASYTVLSRAGLKYNHLIALSLPYNVAARLIRVSLS